MGPVCSAHGDCNVAVKNGKHEGHSEEQGSRQPKVMIVDHRLRYHIVRQPENEDNRSHEQPVNGADSPKVGLMKLVGQIGC